MCHKERKRVVSLKITSSLLIPSSILLSQGAWLLCCWLDEENIERKVDSFKEAAKTDKSIIVTMITTMGLERNEHSEGIQKVITLDQLFC